MSGAERFITLMVAVLTCLALTGSALRVLWTISWRLGQLVERFDAHARAAEVIHTDQEQRLRLLERPGRRRDA